MNTDHHMERMDRPTRIRVSGPELHEKWMSTAATGMTDDLQAQVRIVTMEDGTEYEATFTEVAQQQATQAGDAS